MGLAVLGYLAGRHVGAAVYNSFHIYAVPFLLMVLGAGLGSTLLIAGGALSLAHIGFDRALGLGLKAVTGFRDTHLGRIGQYAKA